MSNMFVYLRWEVVHIRSRSMVRLKAYSVDSITCIQYSLAHNIHILAKYIQNIHCCINPCCTVCRLGDKVPFVMKGKYGVVHGSVQERFNPYHTFIETGTKEDLDTDTIMKQV
jgi:hypothetical protein